MVSYQHHNNLKFLNHAAALHDFLGVQDSNDVVVWCEHSVEFLNSAHTSCYRFFRMKIDQNKVSFYCYDHSNFLNYVAALHTYLVINHMSNLVVWFLCLVELRNRTHASCSETFSMQNEVEQIELSWFCYHWNFT